MADRFKADTRENLAQRGLHVPVHPARRQIEAAEWDEFESTDRNSELIKDFDRRRRLSHRKLGTASFGGDVLGAIPRFYDPKEYWELSGLPWNIHDDNHRFRLYKWFDLFYRTHPLISILVDIFTRFPLVGMELHSQDKKLKEFYEDIFFDKLDYESFLVGLGREYWVYGQSFPLGSFNETFGIWEREELIDPTLVKVEKVPILGTTQYKLRPIPELVQIAKNKEPKELWYKLNTEYPEIVPYLLQGLDIPVSDVLLKQIAFKVNERDTHGTPLLLRTLRLLIHEEKLMASQDALAERLYSPLILAKLGIPDVGDGQGPWIPSPGELEAFRNDLDYALSSDFRLIVHHFGVEIQNVFGREQMPRLDADFDRIDRKIMAVFGVNPSLLAGGTNAQPYASTALNAEFLNQILRTFQKFLKLHYQSRAYIVAEAQEHYDYEKRGDTRVPIMQEVIEYDDEGNQTIVEKNKLLIPDMKMKVLDMRDEATQRQFMFELKGAGVPIPDSMLASGMASFDFEENLDLFENELVQKTVAQQQAKVKAYQVLQAKGLPIPPDLRAEIEGGGPSTDLGGGGEPGGGPGRPPGGGIMMPPPPDLGGGGITPPIGPRNPQRGQIPEESHERTPIRPPGGPPGGATPPGTMIPGAPTAASTEEDSGPIFERLPRAKGKVIKDGFKPIDEDDVGRDSSSLENERGSKRSRNREKKTG